MKPSFLRKFYDLQRKLDIFNKTYFVFQYRSGDDQFKNDDEVGNSEKYENVYRQTMEILKRANLLAKEFIFITDNIYLGQYLQTRYGFKTTNLNIYSHVGHHKSTLDGITNTMLDFFLMASCSKILVLSYINRGSAFSEIVEFLYDVPLSRYVMEASFK